LTAWRSGYQATVIATLVLSRLYSVDFTRRMSCGLSETRLLDHWLRVLLTSGLTCRFVPKLFEYCLGVFWSRNFREFGSVKFDRAYGAIFRATIQVQTILRPTISVVTFEKSYQQRSMRLRPKTSLRTTIGLCRIFRQMEILKSFDPRASMVDAVARDGASFLRKKRRGLKAYIWSARPSVIVACQLTATWIVFACPTKQTSELQCSRSMTAPTKIGPFIAFEAAMKAPSGDQLHRQLRCRTESDSLPETSEESARRRALERLGDRRLELPSIRVPYSDALVVGLIA
jgi:hypothetical protein